MHSYLKVVSMFMWVDSLLWNDDSCCCWVIEMISLHLVRVYVWFSTKYVPGRYRSSYVLLAQARQSPIEVYTAQLRSLFGDNSHTPSTRFKKAVGKHSLHRFELSSWTAQRGSEDTRSSHWKVSRFMKYPSTHSAHSNDEECK